MQGIVRCSSTSLVACNFKVNSAISPAISVCVAGCANIETEKTNAGSAIASFMAVLRQMNCGKIYQQESGNAIAEL